MNSMLDTLEKESKKMAKKVKEESSKAKAATQKMVAKATEAEKEKKARKSKRSKRARKSKRSKRSRKSKRKKNAEKAKAKEKMPEKAEDKTCKYDVSIHFSKESQDYHLKKMYFPKIGRYGF